MNGFHHNAVKRRPRKSRDNRARSPEEIIVYIGRKVSRTRRDKTVAKVFNAIAIPKWYYFTLKSYGEPFKYHECMTKRYSRPALLRLFGISSSTLLAWVKSGIMPEPIMRVSGTSNERQYWFYHQVQPVYVWYMHMRSRGITEIHKKAYVAEIEVLQRHIRKQEVLFLRRAGHTVINDYEAVAGKYGVFWDTVDNTKGVEN